MLIEQRLDNCYHHFLAAMMERRTTIIKHLACNRAGQVRFGRFLRNEKVTPELILEQATTLTGAAVKDKHILLLEDSSELSFGLLPRAGGLGKVGNGAESGFYIHPVLAVDATERACYGLAAARIYKRPELPEHLQGADLRTRKKYWIQQPLADKTSNRWLEVPLQAQKNCAHARQMTVVADREGDIYEAFDGFKKSGLDFVVRAGGDRPLDGPGQLRRRQQQQAFARRRAAAQQGGAGSDVAPDGSGQDAPLIATVRELLDTLPAAGSYELKLPATDKRSAHTALLDVRYTAVKLLRPARAACRNCSAALDVYVTEVRERASSVVGAEQPVAWVLITSHPVGSLEQALQVVEWYRWRWDIEQAFRLLKSRGMDAESSGLQTYERLANLVAMALVAAVRVLQLVLARDNNTGQDLATGFTGEQAAFMRVLNNTLEGGTVKQRNPYPPGSLAYGSWVIARLGSWDGYRSKPPGPITMHRGLLIFYQRYEGYRLALNPIPSP